mgnify:CR=1 FL=1
MYEALIRLFLNTILSHIYCWLDSGTAYIGNNIVNSTAIELRPLFETLSSKATATSRFPSFLEYPRLPGFPLQFVTWNFPGNTPNGILTFRDLCTVINSAVQQRDCTGRSWHTAELKRRDCRYDRLGANSNEVVLEFSSTILRRREIHSVFQFRRRRMSNCYWAEDVCAKFLRVWLKR